MDQTQATSLVFLALTIWRESRGQSNQTKTAVGFSVLNRVKNPKWWGNDVLSVVTKKWQYSSLTAPKDPQLTTWPQSSDASWKESLNVASYVLFGLNVINPVDGADSYYDISISAPKWATDDCFVAQLDKIRFYNTDHDHEIDTINKEDTVAGNG